MTAATEAPTRSYPSYSRNIVQRILVNREAAVIAALVIVYVYSMLNVEFFDGPLTTYNLFKEYAPILMLALPMTLIIITGEIDLSVASTLGVCAAACGVLVKDHGFSMLTAVVLTMILGILLGAFNGFLVAYVGLPSLAVTIGTLALYRGLAEGLIQTDRFAQFPPSWQDWPTERIGSTNLPNIVIPVVVLVIIFALLLHFTSFGRGVYEIGQSAETAHFSGVDVRRTKLLLFVMSGLVAAMAGVYVMLKSDSVSTDTGAGFELKVIAVLNSALQLSNQGSEIIQIIIGLLLVVSVIASSFLPRIRELFPRRAVATAPLKTPTSGDESRKVRQ
jgi:rhamnose transport system permease protein